MVSDETGVKVEQALPGTPVVGTAKRIIVTKDTTTIIGGSDDKSGLETRIKQLDALIADCKDAYDKEKLEERRAKLTGGVAVISVGGKTQSELKEKKDLVDDAFNAVKAALKNGIVPGGGVALLKAASKIKDWGNDDSNFIGDEKIGAALLIASLDAPIKMILKNAGESADLIIANIAGNTSPAYGYDVLNKRYVDMIEAGIIDPTSVIISEVDNASSIAGTMLTTAGAIVDVPEVKNDHECTCGQQPMGMM